LIREGEVESVDRSIKDEQEPVCLIDLSPVKSSDERPRKSIMSLKEESRTDSTQPADDSSRVYDIETDKSKLSNFDLSCVHECLCSLSASIRALISAVFIRS
jgi:hypothetical protein